MSPSQKQAAVTLSTRTVHEGRIFTVTVDRVRLPNGAEIDLELVRHPGSVVLIPLAGDSDVILVRQYRYAVGDSLWELPAGSLEAGEDPVVGARRECHEEIGLVPDHIELVAMLWPTPGFCTERMLFYRCSGLRKPSVAATLDEDEDLEPRTFPLATARAMIAAGEIVDMKTVVGIGLV
jgi:ADP-ribose pyrophosphatase